MHAASSQWSVRLLISSPALPRPAPSRDLQCGETAEEAVGKPVAYAYAYALAGWTICCKLQLQGLQFFFLCSCSKSGWAIAESWPRGRAHRRADQLCSWMGSGQVEIKNPPMRDYGRHVVARHLVASFPFRGAPGRRGFRGTPKSAFSPKKYCTGRH